MCPGRRKRVKILTERWGEGFDHGVVGFDCSAANGRGLSDFWPRRKQSITVSRVVDLVSRVSVVSRSWFTPMRQIPDAGRRKTSSQLSCFCNHACSFRGLTVMPHALILIAQTGPGGHRHCQSVSGSNGGPSPKWKCHHRSFLVGYLQVTFMQLCFRLGTNVLQRFAKMAHSAPL